MIEIPLVRVGGEESEHSEPLPVPKPIRAGDAAADLASSVDLVVPAHERVVAPTGFAVAIPPGWCGLLLPRSGLALKHGLTLLNSPGLIDSGYRGELKIILLNTSDEDYKISRGERIAQLLIAQAPGFIISETDQLPDGIDDRGEKGFGSSGN